MGETTEQLKDTVAAAGREMGGSLYALERKAADMKDWRFQFRKHPLLSVGVAFCGAMALGLIAGGNDRDEAPRPVFDEESFDTRARDAGFRPSSHFSGTSERAKRQAGETWEHIMDALLGVAAARAIDFVARAVPGFSDEYSRRHPEHGSTIFGG